MSGKSNHRAYIVIEAAAIWNNHYGLSSKHHSNPS